MTPTPLLSVIVPAYQGAGQLPQVLDALCASDLPRAHWELIVVDDGSTDSTADIAAARADHVISLPGPPRGPAHARNRGVLAARGEWVVFIDADVVVHRGTLSGFAARIKADPTADAIFGAYDAAPPAPGFLSQYRNLLHRYVHLNSAGEAETFWTGCGAMRRSTVLAAGSFDEKRYPRPQIEDIELGYRVRDQGARIVLDPEIQGAHLKRWTFWGGVRTDLFDRGIPWVRLLLERGKLAQRANLNLKAGERLKALAVALGLMLLLIAPVAGRHASLLLIVGVTLFSLVALSNLPQFVWFARERSPWFALATVPMNIWYYLMSGTSVAIALGLHMLNGRAATDRRRAERTRSDAEDVA